MPSARNHVKSVKPAPARAVSAESAPEATPRAEKRGSAAAATLFPGTLAEVDPDVQQLVRLEEERQARKLIFIASESLCPKAAREAVASCYTHLYAEGYPSPRMRENPDKLLDYDFMLTHHRRYSDRRYYKGCDYADFVEALAQRRLALLFANDRVPADRIFANVQSLSGAAANNAVYEAFVRPGEVVLGLNLSHGGHLTHGSRANRSGKNYRAVHYGVDPETGRIDLDQVLEIAKRERPRLIITGASAYPLKIDWEGFRRIADEVDAVLLADIAHPAGLVAAGLYPSPVGIADVVTFTTHKTLCGPRGAAILTTDEDTARRIDRAVFPGEQGGPHVNAIAGKAVSFKLDATPEFRKLMKRVLDNSLAMAESFRKRGHKIVYGGTESHLFLVDLKPLTGPDGEPKLTGEIASRILDIAHVTCNKNTIPGDTNAAHPSALRLGTTWVSQRGLGPKDLDEVVEQIDRVLRAIRPFRYAESSGHVGRGKLDFAVLRSAQRAIDEIGLRFPTDAEIETTGYPHFEAAPPSNGASAVREGALADLHRKAKATLAAHDGILVPMRFSTPKEEIAAAESGAAVFDGAGTTILAVAGERAGAFLQETATANVLALEPGRSARTAFLDKDGKPIDPAAVVLRRKDRAPAVREYWVMSGPGAGRTLAHWFRALSDGYVIFDEGDLLAKVEGPVSVTEVTGYTRLAVLGPRAREVVEKALGKKSSKAMITITPSAEAAGLEPIEVLVEDAAAVETWKALTAKDLAHPAGAEAAEKLIAKAGLGAEVVSKRPDLVDRAKPTFVGRAKVGVTSGRSLAEWKFRPPSAPLRKSCLYEEHRKLTKPVHIVPFAGWSMPVQYSSIQEEHRAVREAAGLFDVTHMGVFGFAGEGAARLLDLITANYVRWLRVGQAQYSYLLHPDGAPLDDILVYRIAPERFMMVVNAANCDKAKQWIAGALSRRFVVDREDPGLSVDATCEFWDMKDEGPESERRADVALQGPASTKILEAAGGKALAERLARLHRFDFLSSAGDLAGLDLIISRTGYTGEEVGYEIYVNPTEAPVLWNRLLEKGKPFGLAPAGLGARDSTRTEAGLPLYGHELEGPFDIWPNEAGYGAFVKPHKPWFVGRKPYLERDAKRTREVVRFRASESGARKLKLGDPVTDVRGEVVGHVTSCTLIAGAWQGLAIVDRRAAKEGTELRIFPLPPGERAAAEKTPSKLAVGDRALLAERATVMPRFPKAGSMKPAG